MTDSVETRLSVRAHVPQALRLLICKKGVGTRRHSMEMWGVYSVGRMNFLLEHT